MNPFDFARIALDTNHWDQDNPEPQIVLGMLGALIFLITYVHVIAYLSPMLGGGVWYAATALTPLAVVITLEVVVPILSDQPPWTVAVLGLIIGPAFLLIWIPWISLWVLWRGVRMSWILRVRTAWRGYWVRRRWGSQLPRATIRTDERV